jgi:protein-tyrosine-phosphatase
MQQRGIDVSHAVPRKLTPELASTAQWLITMGCGDECPVVPGVRRDDWPILDPRGQSAGTVTAIADDIDARVRAFADAAGLR